MVPDGVVVVRRRSGARRGARRCRPNNRSVRRRGRELCACAVARPGLVLQRRVSRRLSEETTRACHTTTPADTVRDIASEPCSFRCCYPQRNTPTGSHGGKETRTVLHSTPQTRKMGGLQDIPLELRDFTVYGPNWR